MSQNSRYLRNWVIESISAAAISIPVATLIHTLFFPAGSEYPRWLLFIVFFADLFLLRFVVKRVRAWYARRRGGGSGDPGGSGSAEGSGSGNPAPRD